MIIRKITQDDDRLAVSHIYEVSWRYAYKHLIPQEYLDSIPKGRWAANIDNPQINTLIMIEDDMMIGTSSYSEARRSDMDGFGEIISIYLLPEYMGRGYGGKLLLAAADELREMGFANIYLWVLEENFRARHFYEKCGFQNGGIYLADNIGGKDVREIQYRYHGAPPLERNDAILAETGQNKYLPFPN